MYISFRYLVYIYICERHLAGKHEITKYALPNFTQKKNLQPLWFYNGISSRGHKHVIYDVIIRHGSLEFSIQVHTECNLKYNLTGYAEPHISL